MLSVLFRIHLTGYKNVWKAAVLILFQSDADQDSDKEEAPASPVSASGGLYALQCC